MKRNLHALCADFMTSLASCAKSHNNLLADHFFIIYKHNPIMMNFLPNPHTFIFSFPYCVTVLARHSKTMMNRSQR